MTYSTYYGVFAYGCLDGWSQEEGHTNKKDATTALDYYEKAKVVAYDGTSQGLEAVLDKLNG